MKIILNRALSMVTTDLWDAVVNNLHTYIVV